MSMSKSRSNKSEINQQAYNEIYPQGKLNVVVSKVKIDYQLFILPRMSQEKYGNSCIARGGNSLQRLRRKQSERNRTCCSGFKDDEVTGPWELDMVQNDSSVTFGDMAE